MVCRFDDGKQPRDMYIQMHTGQKLKTWQSTWKLEALEMLLRCQEHCCNVSLGEEGDPGCFDDFWTFHSYMAMSKAELGGKVDH